MYRRKLLAIIALILVLLGSFAIYQKFEQKNKIIIELTERSDEQHKEILDLKNNLTELRLKLNISEGDLNKEIEQKEKLVKEIFELKTITESEYDIIGIDFQGKGTVIPLEVMIKSGNGSLFLDVANVLFDETLQSSAQTAVKVAGEIAKTNPKRRIF